MELSVAMYLYALAAGSVDEHPPSCTATRVEVTMAKESGAFVLTILIVVSVNRKIAAIFFLRPGPHGEVSFRRRRSLSFMISLKFATGRISFVPNFMPGCCEIS